jgi:ABC-type lipoprotein release transport system permease subunit
VRTRPGAEALVAAAVERTVRDIDPALPIYDVRTLGEHIEKNLFLRRVPARMFVVLGPLLLVLASVGIYAAVAYALAQRTGEIALRLAVGATPARLVREIAGDGFRAVAAGAVAGWVAAVLINIHLVRAPLFASVFGGVPAIVLLVGAAACWIPAKRASRLDPSSALRQL